MKPHAAPKLLYFKETMFMRIGIGYDVHRLIENRKLVVGGVCIPFEKGLDGHSDADVLTHAVMDALLGAAALGDIGRHFPDSDSRYKDADSMLLLKHVFELLLSNGYTVVNIDSVIIAQKPKFAPYIEEMVRCYCRCLGLNPNQINIKATTEEGLGFTGSGEGIAAKAVCLIQKQAVRFV